MTLLPSQISARSKKEPWFSLCLLLLTSFYRGCCDHIDFPRIHCWGRSFIHHQQHWTWESNKVLSSPPVSREGGLAGHTSVSLWCPTGTRQSSACMAPFPDHAALSRSPGSGFFEKQHTYLGQGPSFLSGSIPHPLPCVSLAARERAFPGWRGLLKGARLPMAAA